MRGAAADWSFRKGVDKELFEDLPDIHLPFVDENCQVYCVRCVIIVREDLFSSQGAGPGKQQGGVSGEDMMSALEEFRRRRGLNEKVIFDGAPDKTIVTIMACSGWHGRRIK